MSQIAAVIIRMHCLITLVPLTARRPHHRAARHRDWRDGISRSSASPTDLVHVQEVYSDRIEAASSETGAWGRFTEGTTVLEQGVW